MTDTIGFIGAGQLGEPMVSRLLDAGHEVVVYARRDEVRDRLKYFGAAPADSLAGVAARSDILISCLFSDAQLREAGLARNGFVSHAKTGSLFVSHTTGTRSTLTELAAAWPTPQAILDAPVSGTADDIAAGTLTVLLGGPADAVARVKPVLAAYADPIIETGELGTALDIKLINNVLFAANVQLVAAAADLGQRFGVHTAALLAALAACSGGSNAAAYTQSAGSVGTFATMAAPFLRKDIAACIAVAEKTGADLGLLRTVIETGPLNLTGAP